MILPGTDLAIGKPEAERKPYFSPSQIKSASLCPRKWHGETVLGWRQPDDPSTLLGRATHEVMQQYLEQTLDHDLSPAQQPEAVLLPALKFLPHPNTPHLLCEQEVLIPAEVFNSGKPLFGFLDVLVLLYFDEERQEEVLWVIDLKTTSNLAYMKSEEELRKDPQALIYSWSGLQRCLEDLNFMHNTVRFTHVYARTRGGYYGAESSAYFTPEELRRGLQQLAEFCRQMLVWESMAFEDVPYNMDGCGKYRGCHLRPECAKTGLPVYGDSPARAAIAQLTITRDVQVKEKVQMSNAFLTALAKKRGSAAAAMDSVLSGSAAPAAPAAFLNPPDGDATGASGLAEAPVDTPPDEDAPVPAPVASPDAGYVDKDKVLPPKADRAAGKRASKPSQWSKLQATLNALLNKDDDTAALVQKIENPLLAQMLSGKAKEQTGPAVDELQQVLDALQNGSYVVHAQKTAPVGDKESDKLTAQLGDAKHAVVVAKDALAKSTQTLRELDDDDDEEASAKYRAEVFLPAKRNVKTAEEQVTVLEGRITAALEREQAEEEQKRRDAEAEALKLAEAHKATVQEAVVEQAPVAVQEKPAEQKSEARAAVSWGNIGPILIKGAVPTRQWRGEYMHIDEIINPYRRRAEQQAMVAYYGAMKTDGDARICELLMADIITGNYKLPALICAPAMCTRLQERVIEAISLYLGECFQPLR